MRFEHSPADFSEASEVTLDIYEVGRLEVYLNAELLIEIECKDPPCHEVILIPEGTIGQILLVRTRDAHGPAEHTLGTVQANYKPPASSTTQSPVTSR